MSLRLLFIPKAEQFVCYDCRFVAQWPEESVSDKAMIVGASSHRLNSLACPQCGRPLHNMGSGFVTPPVWDDVRWQKVAFLVQHDFSFELL